MGGWNIEEMLVVLLFITAAAVAFRRMRHPRMCDIFVSSLPSGPRECGHKAVGSAKDLLGKVYFFCRDHDPRTEWLQERLEARGIRIDTGSIVIFDGSFFPTS